MVGRHGNNHMVDNIHLPMLINYFQHKSFGV